MINRHAFSEQHHCTFRCRIGGTVSRTIDAEYRSNIDDRTATRLAQMWKCGRGKLPHPPHIGVKSCVPLFFRNLLDCADVQDSCIVDDYAESTKVARRPFERLLDISFF